MNVGAGRWEAITAGLELLEAGKFEEARQAVEGHDRSGIGRAVVLVVEGLEHERDGRGDEAERCFVEVYDQGAPVAVVVRECAGFFGRTGDHRRAFQCSSILGDSILLLEGLSGPELVRYAPVLIRDALASDPPSLDRVEAVKQALVEYLGAEPAALVDVQLGGV